MKKIGLFGIKNRLFASSIVKDIWSPYLWLMSRLLSHFIFWFCFVFWSSAIMEWHNFSLQCPTSYFANVIHVISRLPIIMGATYLLVYKILPLYLFEQKSVPRFAFYLGLLVMVTTLIDRSFIAFMDSQVLQVDKSFSCVFFNYQAIIRNLFILGTVMGMAFVIRFYRIHLANEAHRHLLIKDTLSNQLSFLKAQVSPHFLFNALNNIYSDCVRKNEHEIAESIDHLSGIMRYLTYDSNSKLVRLSKEVELIKNYIAIERMRISTTDEVSISLVSEGDFSKHYIIPVLLLPLVENSFKHGIAPNLRCYIHIKLEITGDVLYFETRNSNRSTDLNDGGVGLENVQKRLDLLYKDAHELKVENGSDEFILSLTLNLKNEF